MYETSTNSFIIKIWLEETDSEQIIWRGHITDVTSGERHYLQNLSEIPLFLAPYLEHLGVKLGLCWQIKRWLQQRR